MDRGKAIELLKEALSEIAHLRTLQLGNEEFELWCNKVTDVIEAAFGKDSTEYWRIPIMPIRTLTFQQTDAERKQEYNEYLDSYETALKSIIQKYENLGIETKPAAKAEPPLKEIIVKPPKEFILDLQLIPKAFISHGKESVALTKVEKFLRELGIEPLIVKEQASLDKTLDDKVNYYLGEADFMVILATGDDEIEGKVHPRQNVIHEIGLAQKTHAGKIIYLLEEGAEFPSNISPKVWERFNQENMENVFLRIIVELRGFGMLKWPDHW